MNMTNNKKDIANCIKSKPNKHAVLENVAIILCFITVCTFYTSCKSHTQANYYQPVFDQTEKKFKKNPDRFATKLDTSILIRPNLKDETIFRNDTIAFSYVMTTETAELLIDLEILNEKPLKYDTFLVVNDYLYSRKWVDSNFPERTDSVFIVTDPLAYGFDISEQFRDRDIFNKDFLSKREVKMFQNRDFTNFDNAFTEVELSAPFNIGDSIPYQPMIDLLYDDGNLSLGFDTVYVPYREAIPQFSIKELIHKDKELVLVEDTFFYSDEILFKRFYPEEEDIFIDMVMVEGGDFKMGSDEFDEDERPATTLSVSSFFISKFEITNSIFCHFLNDMKASPDGLVEKEYLGGASIFKVIQFDKRYTKIYYSLSDGRFYPSTGFEDYPVVNITWNGASLFAAFAGCKLVSEAEWEYAARGGVFAIKQLVGSQSEDYVYHNRFAGGDYMSEVGFFADNSYGYCHQAGSMRPNELGIHDMCGNVWEWCLDVYNPNFLREVGRSKDPVSYTGSSKRVVKGGSWSSDAMYCRITNRNFLNTDEFNPYLGFRLCKR